VPQVVVPFQDVREQAVAQVVALAQAHRPTQPGELGGRIEQVAHFEVTRMIMLGGSLYQVPLEFGTPVSFIGSVTGLAGLND